MDSPLEILQQRFQLDHFRPGQQAVIDALLAGRSALAIFPTGGGKSLCYQLPALMFDGLTLVVSPLIALMKDQVDALRQLGIAAERLDSSLTAEEVRALYANLQQGSVKLLYVSPERLKNERFVERLKRLPVSLMAVDEAHCISEWGHNFRPDYLKLAELARVIGVERVLALTATATPAVAQDVRQQFGIETQDQFQTSFRRANLQLVTRGCRPDQRLQRLIEGLQRQSPSAPSIVYVTLQQTAQQVAAELKSRGFNAGCYHAGLKDHQRTAVQDAFMAGDLQIVVATIAFGMGIDKADIRAIFHYNLPKSIENYVQEIGRAGRDGEPAYCELLACADDRRVLANFSYGDTPSRQSLASLLAEIAAEGEQFDLSLYQLSARHDIRPLVVSTVLTYLEIEGAISASGPFYSQYRLAFVESMAAVCQRFEGERRAFLETLFAAGSMGRKWLTLDMTTLEATIAQPRGRILKALDYLERQGCVETSVSGLRQGYRKAPQVDFDGLLNRLMAQFERREHRDIERLEQVLAYASHDDCLSDYLLAYFGENSPQPCGDCSRCQQLAPVSLSVAEEARFEPRHEQMIAALRAEQQPALRQPRQLCRFLCGLPSPATSRNKLNRHPLFGALAEFSFPALLARLS